MSSWTTWIRGLWWFPDARVLDASGLTVIAEDPALWLQEQVGIDGGNAQRTYERLKGCGYVVSFGRPTIYLVQDRGTRDASNFVQLEVETRLASTVECSMLARGLPTHVSSRRYTNVVGVLVNTGRMTPAFLED